MSTQIEQLWYTWSLAGLTGYTHGFRVRAASPGLANGMDYVAKIMQHLDYRLPDGTRQHYTLDLREVPVCLALVDGESERLLVRKQYIGRDGEGRPGNYFAHLLTGLPPTFSARDAIDLWLPAQGSTTQQHNSSIWAFSEEGLPLRERMLPHIPYEQLLAGRQVPACPEWLDLEGIQTYLPLLIHDYVISYLTEKKVQRFCLGSSSSNRIASLIWGLTHGLPLTWVRDLTFSTYEPQVSRRDPDLSKCNGIIVGMGRLASQRQYNASTVPNFGTHVRSLNCDTDTPPPLSRVHPDLMHYAQYVTQCIMTGHLDGVLNFLEQAESEGKTRQFEDFLNFYREEVEGGPLTKERCSSILALKKTEDWKQIQGTRFAQDLFMWILKDPSWWQSSIEKKVSNLHVLAEQMTKQGQTEMAQGLRNVIVTLADPVLDGLQETIRNKDWQHFRFLLDVLQTAAPPATDTTYWPMLFKTFMQERGTLAEAGWMPFRDLLTVLKTSAAPAPDSPFWPAFVKMLAAYKKEMLQLISYQDKNGQSVVWVPFAYLMETLAAFAPPISYGTLWVSLLTILTEERDTLMRSRWLPFMSLLQLLKTTATPEPDSLFWSALLEVVKTNKREMQQINWRPLLDLLDILASPGKSDSFYVGLLDVLDNDAEEIKKQSWFLYEKLMTHWGRIAALESDPRIQQHWLPVPTEQLEAFFALARSLPPSWYTEVIRTYIAEARSFDQSHWQTAVVVVIRNIQPFMAVVRSLVLVQEHGWDQITAKFFIKFLQEQTRLVQEQSRQTQECIQTAQQYSTLAQEQDILAQEYRKRAQEEDNKQVPENDKSARLAQQYSRFAQEYRGRAQEQAALAQEHTAFVEQLSLDKVALLATVLYLEDIKRADNAATQVRLPAVDIADHLLETAHLNEVEASQLLKSYGLAIMRGYGLLPAIHALLGQYLVQLDVKHLDQTSTQKLLAESASQLNLAETRREEWNALQRLVWSWCVIQSFIDQTAPRLTLTTLKHLSSAVEIIISSCPDTSKQDEHTNIAGRLLPLLAETITTEEVLSRVLDHMGPVLGPALTKAKESKKEEELALALLLSLSKLIGARGDNTDVAHLIPYVKTVLARARDVYGTSFDKLDFYVTQCFERLKLKLHDKNVVASLVQASQFWPEETRATWDGYLQRHRPAPPVNRLNIADGKPPAERKVSAREKPQQQERVAPILSSQSRQLPSSPQRVPPNVSFPSPITQKPVGRGRLSILFTLWPIFVGAAIGFTIGFLLGLLVLIPLASLIFGGIGLLAGGLMGFVIVQWHESRQSLEVVARVNDHPVSRTLFGEVCVLKYPYVDYRYNYVMQQILEGEQQKNTSPGLFTRFSYMEKERLQNQLTTLRTPSILEQEVLEELVDDCLIADWMREAINMHQFDYGEVVKHAIDDLIRFQALKEYAALRIQYNLSEQDVANVLAIFARRSIFALYLYSQQNGLSLEVWLETRKQDKQVKIKRYLAVGKQEEKKKWRLFR